MNKMPDKFPYPAGRGAAEGRRSTGRAGEHDNAGLARGDRVSALGSPAPIGGDEGAKERTGKETLLFIVLPLLILAGVGLWFAMQFVQPAPPKFIAISTGSESGGYFRFGRAYRESLKRSGIDLEVRPSRGSVENLERLADKDSGVSIGLVQGGIASADQAKQLLSVGRIFYEPLWVFYRGSETVTSLAQLNAKRIAIGPPGSGTRRLALDLLKVNEITEETARLQPISGRDAAQALRSWKTDAIFLVTSPKSALVQDLLRDPSIRLMSFSQATAYTRLFPYLDELILPRGVIDLVNNVPSRDIHLVAPVAALVVRRDLHSALVSLLAEAANDVHAGDGLFQRSGDFPRSRDPVFEMSDDAKRIYKSGVPFLRRYLPFWMVVWVQRAIVMIVPLLTILLPLFKIVPLIYRWRMRRRILRWYMRLNELERDMRQNPGTGHRQERLAELDQIEHRVSDMTMPMAFTDELFALREHIGLVRNRLERSDVGSLSPIG